MKTVANDRDFGLKPVVKEMVRTRVTEPNIVLLVDKMSIVKVATSDDSTSKDAYRAYLTDHDKSIQAVFKRRIHKQVASLEIREGSYISLKDYILTTGKRLNGNGVINYLAISDFAWVGERRPEGVYETLPIPYEDWQVRSDAKEPDLADPRGRFGYRFDEDRRKNVNCSKSAVPIVDDETDRESPERGGDDNNAKADPTRESSVQISVDSEKHTVSVVEGEVDGNLGDTNNPGQTPNLIQGLENGSDQKSRQYNLAAATTAYDKTAITSASRPDEVAKKRKRSSSPPSRNDSISDFDSDPSQVLPVAKAPKQLKKIPNTNISSKKPYPWAIKAARAGNPLQPINRPLKLSTLASVTGRNASRNKVVDILAIVDSVDASTTKPAQLPLKRDIRIIDASTDRKVTVSIFVDPVNCIPIVGDIILFRNLVTHEFRGGALNAYPHYCEGRDWCIPDPYYVEGRYPDLDETRLKLSELKSRKPAG